MVNYREADIAAGRLQQEITARANARPWLNDHGWEWRNAAVTLLKEARDDAKAWRDDAIALRKKLGLHACETMPDCPGCPDCRGR